MSNGFSFSFQEGPSQEDASRFAEELDRERGKTKGGDALTKEEEEFIKKANRKVREFVDEVGKEKVYGFFLTRILSDLIQANVVLLKTMVLEEGTVTVNDREFSIALVERLIENNEMMYVMSVAMWGGELADSLQDAIAKTMEEAGYDDEEQGESDE